MPRRLKPDYLRRIMAQEAITGLAAVFLTGEQFGVSQYDESLMTGDGEWVDEDAPRRYQRDRWNYKGWSETSKLYCAKCWTPMTGVPRKIIAENWCGACNSHLFAADDERRLDFFGYWIYKDRASRYMKIAIRHFPIHIVGHEYFRSGDRILRGYHKDHIHSLREAFENDIPAHVVSAPTNLRVIPSRNNISKGRKSGCTTDELLASYDDFVTANPEWLDLIHESDARQDTLVCRDKDETLRGNQV